MQLSLSFINAHQQHYYLSANHISERIMAHFSAFFTAILLLLCALLIEQLAVAQSYGQLLDSDESEYDYGPQNSGPRPGGGGGGGRSGLSQEPDQGTASETADGIDEEASVLDGMGDREGTREDVDEDDVDSGEIDLDEDRSNQRAFDPDDDEDTEHYPRPSYRQYLYGSRARRQRNNRAHGQGFSYPGMFDQADGAGAYNHYGSPFVNPDTMPTLPEEGADEEDGDVGSAESQEQSDAEVKAPEVELEPESEPEPEPEPRTDTLVTVQEGNSKAGNFRWRIVASMNKV